jgi:hypothetical protein
MIKHLSGVVQPLKLEINRWPHCSARLPWRGSGHRPKNEHRALYAQDYPLDFVAYLRYVGENKNYLNRAVYKMIIMLTKRDVVNDDGGESRGDRHSQ